jgi:hypothetical protein
VVVAVDLAPPVVAARPAEEARPAAQAPFAGSLRVSVPRADVRETARHTLSAPAVWPGPQVSGTLARPAPRSAEAERARPAPRWKPVTGAPRTGGSAPGSGATATVAGPGAASGLGLPVFLVLLIFAAVLDLARRVALERVTLPSGHWRRPPDTPG